MNYCRIKSYLALTALLLLVACDKQSPATGANSPAPGAGSSETAIADVALIYPEARRGGLVEEFHGVQVADPYRWLEDLDSEETRAWVNDQVALSSQFLETLPGRSKITARLRALWDYARYTVPTKTGEKFFYQHNAGLANQYTLYVADSATDVGRVLLDPNTLSADGTIALSGTKISADGKYLAYGLADAGSDWNTWRVRDIETGDDLTDEINWVRYSQTSWMADGSGFFYSRYDEPVGEDKLKAVNYYQKMYFHKLGTEQSVDQLIHQRTDEKEYGFSGSVVEGGDYLTISTWKGSAEQNLLSLKKLPLDDTPDIEVVTQWEGVFSVQGYDGETLYVLTDLDAPRYRLVGIDPRHPARENWQEIIPQQAGTLEGVSLVSDQIIAVFLTDAHSKVYRYKLDGTRIGAVNLPGIGRASGFTGKLRDDTSYYSYQSFTRPSTVYALDMASGESTVIRAPDLKFDPEEYLTEQKFYSSKDGTQIPMFISHRKDLKQDPGNPLLLYGYGGFNVSMKPRFSVTRLAWMEMGGTYVVANLRGGGEYGREWHEAGMKLNKQNVFDDFISAAEYLVAQRYTAVGKIAIMGGSNGGLLVGAVEQQRPDLFAAALPAVGVMDMLRFREFTIGWAWQGDYGNVDNKDEFDALYRYSPVHNAKLGTQYPPTLITTADHDDRVYPAHSFKFAATMQRAQKGSNPIIIRIETKAGHGAGKPTSKRIAEAADQIAFISKYLDVKP